MSEAQVAIPRWLTVQQLAAELGLPKQTIYKWRVEGRGPRAHKIGRHVRFSREAVDEWLAEQLEDA